VAAHRRRIELRTAPRAGRPSPLPRLLRPTPDRHASPWASGTSRQNVQSA
jgi:hypothetical protein